MLVLATASDRVELRLLIREGSRRVATGREDHLLSMRARGELQRKIICPRRATKGHEDHLLSTEGRGELQRKIICPRRATKGHEDHLLSTEGPRRTATENHLSTKGHEGPRRPPFVYGGPEENCNGKSFVHEGPRRATKNGFCFSGRVPVGDDGYGGRRSLVCRERRSDSGLE